MRFKLSKNPKTGAVTIAYKEPEGFPIKFKWTATVALDGTIKSTPMVIKQQLPMPAPQPAPQPVQPPANQ